jgi:two-component system sensor histidine kinase UhpB
VSVEDDGTGITPGHRVGLGLSGMRERVEALGAFIVHASLGLRRDGRRRNLAAVALGIDREGDPDNGSGGVVVKRRRIET